MSGNQGEGQQPGSGAGKAAGKAGKKGAQAAMKAAKAVKNVATIKAQLIKWAIKIVVPLIIVLIIGFVLVIVLVVGAISGNSASASACADGGPSSLTALATNGPINVGDSVDSPYGTIEITEERMANAQIIVRTGLSYQPPLPTDALIIAVTTSVTESILVNSSEMSDLDSVGLFQQRTSQGWGTVEQIMDPVYSSTKFYDALLAISKPTTWDQMTASEAAHKVQRSAHPDRFDTFVHIGAGLVESILPALEASGTTTVSTAPADPDAPTSSVDPSAPSTAVPVSPIAANADCETYATGNGGDPSDCPAETEIPAGTNRAGVNAHDLCVESVRQARSPEAGKAIIWAFHHLGIPYGRPDGKCATNTTRIGPSHYDCSGFTTSAYTQTGTNMGGNPTTAIFNSGGFKNGYQISAEDARPGDLLLPSTGHIVMVLADDLIVHTSRCGDVSNIRTKYDAGWMKYWAITPSPAPAAA